MLFCAAWLLLAVPLAKASSLEGFISAGVQAAGGGVSWRDGAFGRLDGGAEEDRAYDFYSDNQLLLTLGQKEGLSFVLQGALREGPAEHEDRAAGVVQAFGSYKKEMLGGKASVRLGFFFLPSSVENSEAGWSSPYTITFSALNTWLGEEVRPTGLELAYQREVGGHELSATATIFGGTDAAGALLAWRGFAMSSRVALWGEALPLPPLPSLARNDQFGHQRDDGTQSFGDDLDGRPGYFFALRWQKSERFLLQIDHWDNRGDRHLYRGEYAWSTRYNHLAFSASPTEWLEILGEHLEGETGMGRRSRAHVDVDYRASYLLASWHRGPYRLSIRRDEFEVEDHDGVTEPNDDQGKAWTAAFLLDSPSKAWRFGFEWLKVEGEHPAATVNGADRDAKASSLRLEVRYYFGS